MYNVKYWKHCSEITVRQFCDYLQKNIPPDAIMHVCGDSQIYMHLENDGSAFSVDESSLSDLPEYEDCEVSELVMGEMP